MQCNGASILVARTYSLTPLLPFPSNCHLSRRLAQYGCVVILVLRMQLLYVCCMYAVCMLYVCLVCMLLAVFMRAGVLLWAASVFGGFGRTHTARVPRVRAHYRHPHAPRVGDLATAHSRRAFTRPLRLAVRSTPVTALSTARRY